MLREKNFTKQQKSFNNLKTFTLWQKEHLEAENSAHRVNRYGHLRSKRLLLKKEKTRMAMLV